MKRMPVGPYGVWRACGCGGGPKQWSEIKNLLRRSFSFILEWSSARRNVYSSENTIRSRTAPQMPAHNHVTATHIIIRQFRCQCNGKPFDSTSRQSARFVSWQCRTRFVNASKASEQKKKKNCESPKPKSMQFQLAQPRIPSDGCAGLRMCAVLSQISESKLIFENNSVADIWLFSDLNKVGMIVVRIEIGSGSASERSAPEMMAGYPRGGDKHGTAQPIVQFDASWRHTAYGRYHRCRTKWLSLSLSHSLFLSVFHSTRSDLMNQWMVFLNCHMLFYAHAVSPNRIMRIFGWKCNEN